MSSLLKLCSTLLLCTMLQGCLGTIVGNTVDVVIEVVKIPFKVGGAVVDVVSGDGSKKEKETSSNDEGDQ